MQLGLKCDFQNWTFPPESNNLSCKNTLLTQKLLLYYKKCQIYSFPRFGSFRSIDAPCCNNAMCDWSCSAAVIKKGIRSAGNTAASRVHMPDPLDLLLRGIPGEKTPKTHFLKFHQVAGIGIRETDSYFFEGGAVQCSAVQCSEVQCSAVQCSAVVGVSMSCVLNCFKVVVRALLSFIFI